MKVKDVIKSMQNYDLEDEIVIMWWSKKIFDDDDDEIIISKDVWNKVVEIIDNSNHLDSNSENIYDIILEELREQEYQEEQ